MGKIKNMGTATMRFKEGVIVTGSVHQPNGTDSDFSLVTSGNIYVTDAAQINTVHVLANGRVGIGTDAPAYKLEVGGSMSVGEKIIHRNDDDTFIRYQDDVLSMSAGGVEFATLEENSSQPSNFFVNKGFADMDFSVMGQGLENMDLFYVDASDGNVGIGTQPEENYKLHVSGGLATYVLIGEGSGNQKSTSAASTIFHANRGNESVTGSVGVTSPAGGIGKFIMGSESSHDLEVRTGGVARLFCSASGGVGVATSTPNEALTVNGTISIVESGITPNADSGYGKVYVKSSDSKLYFRSDGGTEYDLTQGAANVAGSDTQLQYNNGGAMGGAARLYYDDVNDRLGIKSSSPSETLEVNGNIATSGKVIFTTSTEGISVDAGSNYANQKILAASHTGITELYGTSLFNRGTSSGNALLLSSSADIVLNVGTLGGGTDSIRFKKDDTSRGEINVTNTDIELSSNFGLSLITQNNKDIDLNSGRNIVFKHSPGGGGTYTGFTFDISDTANGTAELRSPHDLTISNRLGSEKDITIDSDKDLNLHVDQDVIVRCNGSRNLVISGSTSPSIFQGGSSVDGSIGSGILAISTGDGGSYLAFDENTIQAKTSSGDSAKLFINSFGSGDVILTDTGNVGIGDSSPTSRLNVVGNDGSVFAFKVEGTQNDTVLLASFVNDNTSTSADGIGISIGPDARSSMTSGNKFIKLRDGDGTDCGFIEATSSGNVDITNAFTGGHPIGIVSGSYEIGSIIETSGDMWVKILDNVSDSFPYVNLCTSNNSKKVFGVICCTSWAEGKNPWAGTIARHPIKEGYQLAQCNSVGEGSIIVTNINGDIENGDYITSSEIMGYGQKQSDDILHNYTVAKCIEEVNWSTVTDTIEHEGVTYKKYLIACTYHCG